MSDDTTKNVELTRADWSYPLDLSGDDAPRRFDNPLLKGLVVLLMLAVATTVLVAADDEGEGTVVASGTIESEPLAPEAVEPPATSVQEVAGDTASSDAASDDRAEPWAVSSALSQSISIEHRRQRSLENESTTTAPTTTEAPTTTAPPTTAAPATVPPTTEPTTSEVTTTSAGEQTTSTDSVPVEESTTAPPEESTTTAPPQTTTTVAGGDGWVDSGNGVLLPPVLLAIRWCESRDDYQAANPSSSARGAYQFLSGSWRAYGHADRYGVSTADQAGRAQQDEAALITWERDGTRPWNASRHCWSSRI